jgi:hypothetical protein
MSLYGGDHGDVAVSAMSATARGGFRKLGRQLLVRAEVGADPSNVNF